MQSDCQKKEIDFREKAIQLLDTPGYASTGCTVLDCAVGGGYGLGFPFGRIINIVGDKSSGKTFLSNEIIASNFHKLKNFKWNYDDSETGYTFDTMAMYGLSIMHDETLFSKTVEEMDVNMYNFLKSLGKKDSGVYVIDSLDGLGNAESVTREKERVLAMKKSQDKGEDFQDKGSYQMKSQKFLSQEFFRQKAGAINDKNVLLIFVSQIRDKIDAMAFGKKWTRSGGKALDFYAHSVLVLAQVAKIKIGDDTVGVVIKALLDKSKTPRPYRQAQFTLYFDYGIDDIGSNIDYLYDLRSKKGELLKSANHISSGGVEKNIKTYKTFLKENELYDTAREQKKAETGKANLSLDWVEDWVFNNADNKIKSLAENYFGETCTRDELIARAEADPEFERELKIRVIAKWEEHEYTLKTKRKKKYEGN